MTVKNILFDNDETLYRLNAQLRQALMAAFLVYTSARLGIPTDEVMPLRNRLFGKYGVDYSAYLFEREYGITYDEFVRGTCMSVDLLRNGVAADPKLRSVLGSTDARMSILTNNYSEYAWKVVSTLGVSGRFEKVIGAREMGFAAKPDIRAFLRAGAATGYDPQSTMFVDDKKEFLLPAKQLGMTTVLVGGEGGYAEPWIDHKLSNIYEIGKVLRG
ncbi:MAG: HAD-IA family hydrolase [Candidatus Micrarchaeota archaeon]|nr:HAD-IA family hydrolase [Candidatus Micrarchaeota archaeon]